jgi:hypothetical protein
MYACTLRSQTGTILALQCVGHSRADCLMDIRKVYDSPGLRMSDVDPETEVCSVPHPNQPGLSFSIAPVRAAAV